ncbi:LuxR C-terminal-related transcriptional regulator [Kribbella sp. NPDC051587]|uniref:helix-turn-helix transcriptional regulator n=1 Tax=Kribbella sp. NPDC051587 TaxID=3364119 RepID=UPI00379E2DD8
MFESLGLSQESLDLYRLLLQQPDLANTANRALLCAELGLPEGEVEQRLQGLRELGFLALRWDNSGDEYPLDPSVTLEALAAKRQSMIGDLTKDLESDRLRASEFISDYNKFLTQSAVPDVEILDSGDKANLRMQRFHPVKSMWGLIRPGQLATVPDENFADKRIQERGVECRYLIAESQLKFRGAREYIALLQEVSGQVRIIPSVPFKLVIFDGESVAMNLDPDNYDAGAVVHHSKAVVRMAVEMYEHYWRFADRSFERTPEAGELSGQESEFLRFLVQGATDEQVARKLGVSMRTVRRMAAKLSEQVGASGRFELGVRAAQRGWVD